MKSHHFEATISDLEDKQKTFFILSSTEHWISIAQINLIADKYRFPLFSNYNYVVFIMLINVKMSTI